MNAAFMVIGNRYINFDRILHVEIVKKGPSQHVLRLHFAGGDQLDLGWDESQPLLDHLRKSSVVNFGKAE